MFLIRTRYWCEVPARLGYISMVEGCDNNEMEPGRGAVDGDCADLCSPRHGS
jgi:hypothetical protein